MRTFIVEVNTTFLVDGETEEEVTANAKQMLGVAGAFTRITILEEYWGTKEEKK